MEKGEEGKKGGGSSSCYGRLYIELAKSGMKRSYGTIIVPKQGRLNRKPVDKFLRESYD